MSIRRIYVTKKEFFKTEANNLLNDIKINLGINLENLTIYHRYDIENLDEQTYTNSLHTIFSEPQVDEINFDLHLNTNEFAYVVEYLPGQYDMRADSAMQCVKLINPDSKPNIKVAKVYVLKGVLNQSNILDIKAYTINPVDSREGSMDLPQSLDLNLSLPKNIKTIHNFIKLNNLEIKELHNILGLAMTIEDLIFTRDYFISIDRNPTITEIRVLDTYWSDHCRHTTFLTKFNNVDIVSSKYNDLVKKTYELYRKDREELYSSNLDQKPECLMDIALLAMKKIRKDGLLDDLEVSDEINACSIIVNVDIDGQNEEWLVQFKNETHNHPTEIEPFGGAATCLGGAIRDPLSGRAYVYQAMRVTGAADPTAAVAKTLSGKLPQRKIVTESAHGYSSYGNQIGLATGLVNEIYHPNYVAKRLEIGAVIAATPRENVIRENGKNGDFIVLIGGKTGRDGCGGATGSSKEHNIDSINNCGAEVQKGNPPCERKIQRLFRNKDLTTMIKKCNDFGAGGVSVAIGELADGLIIDLDKIPKKYEGLDGTELAISESQERMAVIISPSNLKKFIDLCNKENLEATHVATVTSNDKLVMKWHDNIIVDIDRKFLDTNGATVCTDVKVEKPSNDYYTTETYNISRVKREAGVRGLMLRSISELNNCSQKGLASMFDSSIGAGSCYMPYGGIYQRTPMDTMVAKIPVLKGDTTTGTIMSYGFNPALMTSNPYYGAIMSVIHSLAKIVATGGDYKKTRFTFQEYFKRLGNDPSRWGEPFSAMLGAYYIQRALGLASIGGKDSMSGTFDNIDVPPTLVSFAVNVTDITKTVSNDFKKAGSDVILINLPVDENKLPIIDSLKEVYNWIHEEISKGNILSAMAVPAYGVSEAIFKMGFGSDIGFEFDNIEEKLLFMASYGSIVLELANPVNEYYLPQSSIYLGRTTDENLVRYQGVRVSLKEAYARHTNKLESVYPTKVHVNGNTYNKSTVSKNIYVAKHKIAKPKVFIPVFPGTNCEYDTKKAFEQAGAITNEFVFKNIKPEDIKESVSSMVNLINESNMIMIPGGFSAGDEPDGSGKFIATVFRNKAIKEAVMNLINNRDGLILGICNGFQALIKLGLVPYGEIKSLDDNSPTLSYNSLGKHISCMARTKIMTDKSPWLANTEVGDIFNIPVSHGEGRFIAPENVIKKLFDNGQVVSTYVDINGVPSLEIENNPNGSMYAVEGIISPDGRILGKMGHSERVGKNVSKNIYGKLDMQLFKAGVNYYK